MKKAHKSAICHFRKLTLCQISLWSVCSCPVSHFLSGLATDNIYILYRRHIRRIAYVMKYYWSHRSSILYICCYQLYFYLLLFVLWPTIVYSFFIYNFVIVGKTLCWICFGSVPYPTLSGVAHHRKHLRYISLPLTTIIPSKPSPILTVTLELFACVVSFCPNARMLYSCLYLSILIVLCLSHFVVEDIEFLARL